ncbi:unnamed protein product [marine sediment metagenome]|uniref:Uncharacterized protein n=1 Tax=marine sediment metagenome TaxID=412755 RepID=X1TWA1_9ZZZZ
MVNGMYAVINGAIIVDKIVIIAQEAEPAVPAGKFKIWHDTTVELERRWLVLGTDGTVEGNQKVEIS